MLVYLAAALDALAYLAAVPVCAAFWLTTEGGLRAGVGIGAFERRFALRRARHGSRPLFAGHGRKRKKNGGARRAMRLLRGLRLDGLSLRGSLCLGDAAATAMACGALRAAAAALGTRADRVELSLSPDFEGDALRAELWGMIRVRFGQIILAAAKSGMDRLSRGGALNGKTPN